MKILFSGASSFSGYWMCRRFAEAGHDVVALFQAESANDYSDVRERRVRGLIECCRAEFSVSFGSDSFARLAREEPWDVYCHHGFRVENYRSDSFDVLGAISDNTRELRPSLAALRDGGCSKLVFTGTVFEAGEGLGSEGLPDITYYGLSKNLAWRLFSHEAVKQGFSIGKFVIPNPFGPLEEKRFGYYLMSQWRQGLEAEVRTPDYVRDNIHVSLLARDYVDFVETLSSGPSLSYRYPSGFVGTQGVFTRYLASEVRKRTDWACGVTLLRQTEFDEPKIRINSEPASLRHPEWDESLAWDEFVDSYRQS